MLDLTAKVRMLDLLYEGEVICRVDCNWRQHPSPVMITATGSSEWVCDVGNCSIVDECSCICIKYVEVSVDSCLVGCNVDDVVNNCRR